MTRERLARIGEVVQAGPDVAQRAARRARARRRHRLAAASTAVAAVTAGAVIAAVALTGAAPRASSVAQRPPAAPPVSEASELPAAFGVAAPGIFSVSGPAPMQQPACLPSQITASAQLHPTRDGVAAVAEFTGDHCALKLFPQAARLVDPDGQPLDVPILPDPTKVNPPRNPRPDLALAAGQARWGFAWRGSWCGKPAAALLIPTRDPRLFPVTVDELVRVPLSGEAPGCARSSRSTLVEGVFGADDQPVLPPPTFWSHLTAALTVPAQVDRRMITGLRLTLRNSSDSDIDLSPCPYYAIAIESTVAVGTEGDGGILPLQCNDTTVIPAHGSHTFDLPGRVYDDGDPNGGASPGTQVNIHVAIAGVSTASATARAAG